MDNKSDIRSDIDRIDSDLIKLIAERQACSMRIGKKKRESGEPIFDAVREEEVIRSRKAQGVEEWVKWDIIEDFWALLLQDSKSLQGEK